MSPPLNAALPMAKPTIKSTTNQKYSRPDKLAKQIEKLNSRAFNPKKRGSVKFLYNLH